MSMLVVHKQLSSVSHYFFFFFFLINSFLIFFNLTERFLDKVVKDNSCSSFTNKQLKEKFQFNDENIKELIRNGLLVSHYINVGSYLLSIPNAGEFVKSFNIGKKAVISMIKRSKFQEIAKQEIMKRKLPKECKFSIKFHIYDLIGSNHIKW